MEKDRWRHTRKVAYYSYIGSHVSPDSLPRRENDFIPIDSAPRASEASRELYLKRAKEYYDKVKQLKDKV